MSLALTVIALTSLMRQTQMTEPRLMRTPAIFGDTIAFSYAGDLWITERGSASPARRLTSGMGLEIRPKFSPDGKWIAFSGSYDGSPELYVIPTMGGEPKRLTYDVFSEQALGWTPDGKIAYSSAAGNFTARQSAMWEVDPEGGIPVKTPISEISDASFFPGGKMMAYTRIPSYNFNWRRYRGGSQGRISFYDFGTNTYSELPSKREQSYFPMVSGRSVFYISDRNLHTQNLYRYDMDTKHDAQLTTYTDADVRWPSSDGKSIVWERDGFLWVYDIASGGISKESPKILSENLASRPALKELGGSIDQLDISPSGTRVLVGARGEVFSVPVKTGDTRNLTRTSGARERDAAWSPDGKTIAYMSDASGNWEIYTQPQMGGEPTRLTESNGALPFNSLAWSPDSKMILLGTEALETYLLDVNSKHLTKVLKSGFGLGGIDFSPDSKWLAYTDAGNNQFGALYLYEIATGKATKVTDGSFPDSGVAFDQNGKYLYLESTRTYAPTFGDFEFSLKVDNGARIYVLPLAADTSDPLVAPSDEEGDAPAGARMGGGGPGMSTPVPPPVRIDLNGLGNRLIPLPMPAGSYASIVGANNGVFYVKMGGGPPSLAKFDLGTRESQPIFQGAGGSLAFNPARTKAAFLGAGGVNVIDLRPGATPTRVDVGNVEAEIDPRAEWKEIFWDAWRYERDNFYDPNMVGLNWKGIGDHYAQYLQYVNNRSDLTYILGMMIGELGTGHSYVVGVDPGPSVQPVPVGQLGADFVVENNHVRIGKIYTGEGFDESRRAPLSEPGVDVKAGDYLLAIDGNKLDGKTNPSEYLVGKAGKFVILTVNSTPTASGAHDIRVRPVVSDTSIRYVDFVESNRKRVDELSGGRIGYMHIPDTQNAGAVAFIRGYYSQTDKDAVIVDERWNGGGYIQPWFVDTLARRMKASIEQRNGADNADAVAIEGPKAMLINDYAGSGGDFFPYMFRQANLGPLIGRRTWGGLVGIAGFYTLVDGGQISSPEFAIFDRNTGDIIAENNGIAPDIDVDARPDLIAKGQDPQLDAAIKYLMDQLAKAPAKKPRVGVPRPGLPGRGGGN